MNEDKNGNASLTSLRERAEKETSNTAEDFAISQLADIQRLVHELQVHQIELQMQNEELRNAQIELEASRSKYFDLFNLAPIAYFSVSLRGVILDVNFTGAALLKMDRARLVNRPFSNFVVSDSQDEFYMHLHHVLTEDAGQTCELRLVDNGRREFYARLDTVAERDGDGEKVSINMAVTDINDRVLSEQALKRSEIRFRALAESATTGIFILQDDHVIYANPAIEDILGYSLSELHAMDRPEFIHPDMRQKIADRAMLITRLNSIPLRDEVKIVRKNGETRWVEYSAARMNYGGRPAVIGSVIDITDRKNKEEQIEET